jgi:glycosyltransferase involved in cell wall biosynthesis
VTLAATVEPVVSLVICTRDRAAHLRPMLDSLEALDTAELLEIVFVDNGSTDGTGEILRGRQAETRLPMRIVTENRPGLSNARNAGIRACRGAIVAFTDDDCYPEPGFISVIAGIFRENAVDIVGGPLVLHDPTDHWVSTTLSPAPRSLPPGDVVMPGEISGGCMAFRRKVFESAGLFDPELGAGTRFPIEDAEMVARACLLGHPAGFFVEPVIRHHHRRKRRQGEALVRRFAHGRGAFWAKMLLEFPAQRPALLRHWYWMMRSAMRRNPLSGLLTVLRELAGALAYLTRRRAPAVHRPVDDPLLQGRRPA